MSGSNKKFPSRNTNNSTRGRPSFGRGRPSYNTNLLDCSLGFTPRNSGIRHSPPKPINTNPNPVVHSPPNQNHSVATGSNINQDNFTIPNTIIDFSNQDHPIENPFDRSSELDPIRIVFDKEKPNMPGNEDNTLEGAVGGETTHHTTVDEFMHMLQTALKSSQDEFRKELKIISNSVSNLNTAVQSMENNERRNINTTPEQSRQSLQNSTSNFPDNLNQGKKNVKYDGIGSVSDFIFKIETLKIRTQCADEHLLANFHIFLSGKAESWYWIFLRQNRKSSFEYLKAALTREFGKLETDTDIKIKISLKKQGL